MTRVLRASLVVTAAFAFGIPALAQDLSSIVDSYLDRRTAEPFSGVILLSRNDTVLLERAYGFADADLGVSIRPDMRFGIGSLTKPITATAVLRLAERGRLRLTDSVCRYLSSCPLAWLPVTLHHLLSHTSGIPDLFNDLPAAPVDSTRAVIDAATIRHRGDTLTFQPGQRYAYSNFNYFLLGYALEVASAASWEAVLRREIFLPAKMHDTQYDDVWNILSGRVRGYTRVSGTLRHIRYRDHAAYAAGGLLSTARDLQRFDRALSTGEFISDSSYRMMTTPGLGDYGLGWQIVQVFGRALRNHTGGTNGFASHLSHYDDGTTIIVLSNVETEPVKALACDLAALYFGFRVSDRSRGESPCRATRN
jgi:CubicO group peptidase (beta-lactamase class C family)